MSSSLEETFDVFLSHAHEDAETVERLGAKLEDVAGFRVWLDKWILTPGGHWQQEMARGLNQARTCAVCIGKQTPEGWFREEIERALNRQTRDTTFRVIPVILPGGDSALIDGFLELRTWVDFRQGLDDLYTLHVLQSGIRGVPPGRNRFILVVDKDKINAARDNLAVLRELQDLIDYDLKLEYQRKILDQVIEL